MIPRSWAPRVALAGLVAGTLLLNGCGSPPETDPSLSLQAQRGFEVTRSMGCTSCHGDKGEGVEGLGPPIVGLVGTETELIDGRVVGIDLDYLRRALLDPGVELTIGWDVPMPGYDPPPEELRALLAYMAEAGRRGP